LLTDNAIQFPDLPKNRKGPTARSRGHAFNRVCLRHGIDHRLTKPNHPGTNGQVECMNRTIKEAAVQRYHYDSHHQLRIHLSDFVAADNFAKRLKTLGGVTAVPPTNSSANAGKNNRIDLVSIPSIKCWD
jgi:transposase InsO family protein